MPALRRLFSSAIDDAVGKSGRVYGLTPSSPCNLIFLDTEFMRIQFNIELSLIRNTAQKTSIIHFHSHETVRH